MKTDKMNPQKTPTHKLSQWIICLLFIFSGLINKEIIAAVDKCPTGGSVLPTTDQTLCLGSTANTLTTTITSSGSILTKVRYTWWYNITNSTDTTTATQVKNSIKNLGSSTTDTYTPNTSVTGTKYYFCVVTNNICSTMHTTATVKVLINAPTISVSPTSATICNPGGTAVTLTASGGSTYTWSSTGGTSSWGLSSTTDAIVTALPSSTKTYKITGTDTDGCSNTTSVTVTVSSTSFNSTASPSAICFGSSSILKASKKTYTYVWNPGALVGDSISVSPTVTTTYTVTATTSLGCTLTKQEVITVNPLPIVTVSPASTTFICTASSPTLLTGTITSASGTKTYSWSTGVTGTLTASATTTSITVLPTTTTVYTLTGTSNKGCTSNATATIKVFPNCAVTQVSSIQCGKVIPDLSANFYCDAVVGAEDYQWEFANPVISYLFTKNRGSGVNSISRTLITGLQFGASYNVRVKVKVAGIWGNYGSVCVITMAPFPTTQVSADQCGQIIPNLSGNFYCDAITGAEDYQWEFTNPGISYSYTAIRGSGVNSIAKTLITGLQFGVAYNVRIRVKVGGIWGNYGSPCVLTMASLPTTQVSASQCGQTIPDLSGNFYCDAVSGAEDYQWEFANPGIPYSYTAIRGSGVNSIAKTLITGLQFGVAYNVRIKVKAGGIWGNYGPVCVLTMGAFPTTQVSTSQCNQQTNLSGNFYCDAIFGAQDYIWEFINVTTNYSYVKARGAGVNSISKSLIIGLKDGLVYNVRVRAKVGGVWGSYGNPCAIGINTVSSILTNSTSDFSLESSVNETNTISNNNIKAVIYPNPSSSSGFNINIEGIEDGENNIIVDVYDMFGKRVWTENISNKKGDQITKINENGNFANGVYLIKVNANGQLLQQKIIIQ